MAESLATNTSVRNLNIFNNVISYDGARSFAQTLSTNNTLEYIDFGHNRIRDSGLIELAKGIAKNPNSKIRSLGLKFNFLHEEGIIEFLKTTQ